MNKWEKEVARSLLESEKQALQELQDQYTEALKQIDEKVMLFQTEINQLNEAILASADDVTKDVLLSVRQSKIYQKRYQEALQSQISGIIDAMQGNNYSTIEEYLKQCYEDGFVGDLYDLTQQGIPVVFPINQAQVTKAVLTDSQISEGYYARLQVDASKLKQTIMQELTRGIALSVSYADIARNIQNKANISLHNAQRIARTEGHRIQNQAARDSAVNAVEHGADLVKKWDATLDGKTRESHRMVDGEIRELDELFSNGLDKPGDPNGSAAEVINCRCHEIHLPRWAIGGGMVKMNNFTGEIMTFESVEDYEDFKKKFWSEENVQYMKHVQSLEEKYGTKDMESLLKQMSDREFNSYHSKLSNNVFANMSVLNEDNDWSNTTPRVFTEEDKANITSFAKKHGITINDLSGFDGDPELLKVEIQAVSKYKEEFGIKSDIEVSSAIFDGSDFAKTERNIITFNSLALRDKAVTEKNLTKSVLAGTTLEDIALHEIGHILSYEKSLNGIALSKDVYYNLTGKHYSTQQMVDYLESNVSEYSVEQRQVPWLQGFYVEITPEVIVRNKNNANRFTEAFVNYLKGR